jgi:hypothetical protein
MQSVLATSVLVALLASPLAPFAASALAPKRASDLVTLVAEGEGECPLGGHAFDTRVLSDGSQVPFAMPPGRVLVVTGFDFVIGGAPPGAATSVVVNQQPAGTKNASPVLQADGVASASGFIAGGVTSNPGVAVSGGVPLCILPAAAGGVLHGFLAKDK